MFRFGGGRIRRQLQGQPLTTCCAHSGAQAGALSYLASRRKITLVVVHQVCASRFDNRWPRVRLEGAGITTGVQPALGRARTEFDENDHGREERHST